MIRAIKPWPAILLAWTTAACGVVTGRWSALPSVTVTNIVPRVEVKPGPNQTLVGGGTVEMVTMHDTSCMWTPDFRLMNDRRVRVRICVAGDTVYTYGEAVGP